MNLLLSAVFLGQEEVEDVSQTEKRHGEFTKES